MIHWHWYQLYWTRLRWSLIANNVISERKYFPQLHDCRFWCTYCAKYSAMWRHGVVVKEVQSKKRENMRFFGNWEWGGVFPFPTPITWCHFNFWHANHSVEVISDQKMLFFWRNFFEFRPLWGGDTPHSVNFVQLVFRENSVRYGGGIPPFPLIFSLSFPVR